MFSYISQLVNRIDACLKYKMIDLSDCVLNALMEVMGVYVFEQKKAASRLDGLCCGHSNSCSNPGLAIFSVVFY